MNRISSLLRLVRVNLLFVVLAGVLLALPAVGSYATKPSILAQSDDGLRSYSAASPAFVLPPQKTRLNTNLPSRQYAIKVNPEEFAFTLKTLTSPGKTQPHQIGVGRGVGMRSAGMGKEFANQDGSKIRLLAITSPGAVGLRLHIEQFNLAPGDEVYVYGTSADSYIAGPYTRQGPFGPEKGAFGGAFWTDTIEGDTVIIEHYIASAEKDFYISELSHLYKGIPGNDAAPDVLACHNDAMCFSDLEKDSVGRILFVESGSSFVCTGTIMNNQVSDFAPYFYTASHCVSTQTVAQTVETYWFYRTTSCNSGVVSNIWVKTAAGTSLLATQQTADSTLLRIFNPVPGNLRYAGWDAGAKTIGTSVFGLSHPGTALPPSTESYLRRASGSITSTTSSCSATGLVNGYLADWTSGLVEPGSSGSALFFSQSGNNFVIGALSCGPVPSSCADSALYGKFSDFFPTIQTYMSMGDNTGVCAATPITVGQTVNGSLAASDCKSRVRGVSFNSDRYSFSGTAGQQIFITLSSATFDTYLYLLSPSKTLAAQDDDGGGGTNSRIPAGSGTFSLPTTGTYVIEVTSFDPNTTGSYTLTLGPTGGGCTYSVAPTSANIAAAGGPGSFSVTTQAGCAWTASTADAWILITSGSGTGSGTVNYTGLANTGAARTGTITVQGQTHTVNQAAGGGGGGSSNKGFDFDGDGKADVAVWRPTSGTWFIINSSNGSVTTVNWGTTGDVTVPADYDGDGKTDIAVWRPSTGVWYIINSSNGSITSVSWGVSGDKPVPADYDGDGKADIAVWRPSAGRWFIINSSNGSVTMVNWGASGDVPIPIRQ
jgi:FG-GAP-like repeat/Bacterial pre-peptidase C-terminal domain